MFAMQKHIKQPGFSNIMDFKKEMAVIRRDFDREELLREELISRSRNVIRISKKVIYSVHRSDLRAAKSELLAMRKAKSALMGPGAGKVEPNIINVALMEYAEALIFYQYAVSGSIPGRKSLGVDNESYLLGLIDAVGEITRRAVNSALKEEYSVVPTSREFVAQVYHELMQFDFRNSELRRKFDGIKWELKKLEDLSIELKLKGKI